MLRFGFKNIVTILLVIVIASCSWLNGRAKKSYDEQEMAKLATLTRTMMNIVRTDFIDTPFPATLNETQIVEIVHRLNTNFAELKLLDRYDMAMFSNGKKLAAVAWDPETDRKLLQDLRCTSQIDEATWREFVFDHDFTLGWVACER